MSKDTELQKQILAIADNYISTRNYEESKDAVWKLTEKDNSWIIPYAMMMTDAGDKRTEIEGILLCILVRSHDQNDE